MKILFLTKKYWPHIGGVEKHVAEISRELQKRGNKVTIITEKYSKELRSNETIGGIKIIRFSYPHFKMLGLLNIWFWLWQNRSLIKQSDVIHCHDIFIWYLPFCLIYPYKKVFITIHGYEPDRPFSWISIFQKKVALKLSNGSIGVGRYLEKYIGAKFDKIIYGGITLNQKLNIKNQNDKSKFKIVYVGRLENNTGLGMFIEWLKVNGQGLRVDFCGDGPLRDECGKYGKVHGFCDPTPFLRKAEICVPGGYLAYLEAKSYGCLVKTYAQNRLRKDYWRGIKMLKKVPTWEEVADEYLNLYHSAK